MGEVIHADEVPEWCERDRSPAQILDCIDPSEMEMIAIIGYSKDGRRLFVSSDYTTDKMVTLLERTKLSMLISHD